MSDTSQYGDLYDEDTNTLYEDQNTRCKHGTYIGTPGGPDFMCGQCEMGDDEAPITTCADCGLEDGAITAHQCTVGQTSVWYDPYGS